MLISQQTDLNALFTGNTNAIMTELQRYGDSITVNGTLGLSNISDDFARRLFMHQILYSYKKNNISERRTSRLGSEITKIHPLSYYMYE